MTITWETIIQESTLYLTQSIYTQLKAAVNYCAENVTLNQYGLPITIDPVLNDPDGKEDLFDWMKRLTQTICKAAYYSSQIADPLAIGTGSIYCDSDGTTYSGPYKLTSFSYEGWECSDDDRWDLLWNEANAHGIWHILETVIQDVRNIVDALIYVVRVFESEAITDRDTERCVDSCDTTPYLTWSATGESSDYLAVMKIDPYGEGERTVETLADGRKLAVYGSASDYTWNCYKEARIHRFNIDAIHSWVVPKRGWLFRDDDESPLMAEWNPGDWECSEDYRPQYGIAPSAFMASVHQLRISVPNDATGADLTSDPGDLVKVLDLYHEGGHTCEYTNDCSTYDEEIYAFPNRVHEGLVYSHVRPVLPDFTAIHYVYTQNQDPPWDEQWQCYDYWGQWIGGAYWYHHECLSYDCHGSDYYIYPDPDDYSQGRSDFPGKLRAFYEDPAKDT